MTKLLNQNISSYIAMAGILAAGIGASYIIISFANGTDFSFVASFEVNVGAESEK